MLSFQQAIEVKESISAYLRATFSFQDKKVDKAFFDFIHHPTDGMFKGPYVSLKLPFVKANTAELASVPLQIKPEWLPYDHQVKAWHRLSAQDDHQPQPTIITTGTGSGKTESFLYPILDYCYQNAHRPGIKAIILYPMNALASDQAKRLAEIIHQDDRLRGKLTAGLFVGEGKDAAKYPKNMGADHIIENRMVILDSPPDILLTNFKMLDYGLMRAPYHSLWYHNLRDTNLLRFLALDELHTYDGAQGTDVANLIRRLKLKLYLTPGQLVPVGTSATIGSGEEAPALLADYASKVFGEPITPEAIITENRVRPANFFSESSDDYLPRQSKLGETTLRANEHYDDFLRRQINLWTLNADTLAEELARLDVVRDLVVVCNETEELKTIETIEQRLSDLNPRFRALPQWDNQLKISHKRAVVESLLSLISVAKAPEGKKMPFLYLQTQLWIRELSGVLRSLSDGPQFTWKDKQDAALRVPLALPPWFCRECGASGWLGVKHDNKDRFERDINDIYQKFFANHKHIYFVNHADWLSLQDLQNAGYEPTDLLHKYVGAHTLEFFDEAAEGRVHAMAVRKLDKNGRNEHVCPECNSRNTLAVIGTRTATLSSVAISQTLSTELDPLSEKDRKVLAFTNSVQDAAHQAGFIEARNYNFSFRTSLQTIINQQAEPIELETLSERFIAHWKTHADETGHQPLNAYYYRFYPKDYLGKSSPRDYEDHGRYEPHFEREFDLRMRWETLSEFGYNAGIGRTLEKTGASGAFFSSQSLRQVWQDLQPWLEANALLPAVGAEAFESFVHLLLYRARIRGAVKHPYLSKFREEDYRLWDLNWMRDSRHFLNRKFSPKQRLPRLLTAQREIRGLLDSTYTRTSNWFHAFYKKSFPMASNYVDVINDFYGELLSALAKREILSQSEAGGISNFAIEPAHIFVSNRVRLLQCDSCGHSIHTGDVGTALASGSCLMYRCSGHYVLQPQGIAPNYYQLVYNRSRSPRIYAADHTGLLERKRRELLEAEFKNRTKFNSKNVMVATSTLEMGIDIGTLNTAYNNAVPPLPSNFLQRIGRAGRASGSALIINFAQSKAHDRFYFQEPNEMMAGKINSPGCYLEAREILKRHFFAFCIDSWASENDRENSIPSKISHLKLETDDLQGTGFFMNRLLSFVKTRERSLFERFTEQYRDLDPGILNELKGGFQNESFYFNHRQIFKKLRDELLDLNQQKKETLELIKTRRLGKDDPERLELERELKNLGGIASSIKKRNTLEHLTNVGALPNYAFPETGVTLLGRVTGQTPAESTKPPLDKDFEIVRSAGQALRELSPDNSFYSQGFRFKISGINTFDWAEEDNFHSKRFCSHCDHLENAATATEGNCPKCGSESWRASSNVHAFAKLRTVKSFNLLSEATLDDAKDERDNERFFSQRHFQFDTTVSQGAWAMKEIPFGIEFVRNVSLIDTNLGRANVIHSRRLRINDEEVPAPGFVTCRHCGKSSSGFQEKDYKFHYGFCRHKEATYQGKRDAVFEEVYFFREVQTECLKILLPVQEFNSEAEIEMFQAGIELGLRHYFRGNPQHLRLSQYKEFNHKTLKFDRYLLLYDTVPGGTGYLEKLFHWQEFNKLLLKSYEALRTCGCQHEGKDGCYHCVYSYGNQYHQENLSRAKAEKRFEEIILKNEGWESQPLGLGSLTNDGQIEESELESRFVRSLRHFAAPRPDWTFGQSNDDGMVTYTLVYRNEHHRFSYVIRPQVELGPADGVEYHTRTDFMVICTEALLDGQVMDTHYDTRLPKVAIYLDGYQYHASSENNRFENDLRKRRAILQNPAFVTWTLTWEDIERFDEGLSEAGPQPNRADGLSQQLQKEGFRDSAKALLKSAKNLRINVSEAQNNLERLLKFLEYPIDDAPFRYDWATFLGLFQAKLLVPSYPPTWMPEQLFGDETPMRYCVEQKTLDGWVKFQGVAANPFFEAKTFVNIHQNQVESELLLHDSSVIDKGLWNQFWTYFNCIQFFPVRFVSVGAAAPNVEESTLLAVAPNESFLSLYDDALHPIIRQLFALNYVQTERDEVQLNALLDEEDNEIAGAELIIPHLKIAIHPYSPDDETIFLEKGYQLKSMDDLTDLNL